MPMLGALDEAAARQEQRLHERERVSCC
jgi:hypothetical protein